MSCDENAVKIFFCIFFCYHTFFFRSISAFFLSSLFRDKMMTNDDTKKCQKMPKIFICETCDFKCSKKSNYDKHILTAKHKMMTNDDKKMPKNAKPFMCSCGKKYASRQSLHRHKQKCKDLNEEDLKEEPNEEELNEENLNEEEPKDENDPSYKKLLMEAMKTMQKQQQKMSEMMPLIGNNNNNTTNNTTNNFNLNFFLNETCKDALNITDFIDSLRLQLNDLEYTADNGHVKGITNIFHTALSNMEETKRPMHCTDLKREVLYIKDNDEWQIDEEKDKLKDAVEKVTNKNIQNTGKWLEKYPEHTDPDSKDFEKYMKFTSNCMGTGEESEQNKIMKNIMKDVTIKKE